jgi:hypothetical protein
MVTKEDHTSPERFKKTYDAIVINGSYEVGNDAFLESHISTRDGRDGEESICGEGTIVNIIFKVINLDV